MAQHWDTIIVADEYKAVVNIDEMLRAVMNCTGEVIRAAHGRRTFRFTMDGRAYFAKVHSGAGWAEIAKNLLRLRRPTLGAAAEWRAIQRVQDLGVHTTPPVAFGTRGSNPATKQSFLVTEDLGDTVTLQVLCRDRLEQVPWPERQRLIADIASIASSLHEHGMNHRDLYLCHFRTRLEEHGVPEGPLHLMDLHRAQIRTRVPTHLRIKDIGSLYFSTMETPLTRSDCLRFIRHYTQRPLREALSRHRVFWRLVNLRAQLMQRKELRRLQRKEVKQ